MKNKQMTTQLQTLPNFVIFKIDNAKVNINVFVKDETLWLTQKQIAQLFEVKVPAISKHLKNIFEIKELIEDSVVSKMETTAKDSKKYKTNFYNLKAITAIGYRVNSHRATEFRKWATDILHEYIVKGFAMDDERLKAIHHFGVDYFEEQLDRIRENDLVRDDFIKKLQIFMHLVLIMIKMMRQQRSFMQHCKINFIGLSQVKLLLRLSIVKQMLLKYLWGLKLGKMHHMARFSKVM